MKVASTFTPYTVPVQTLLLSSESHPFFVTQSATTTNSSEDDTVPNSNEKSFDEVSHANFKIIGKKRGRKYKNLKECYKCNIEDCEALFEKESELEQHKKNTHTHVFSCSFQNCSFKFMKEENLNKHLKTHMPTGKKYECPYPGCGKKFTASYNQKIHYRLHTGERPYKCDICQNEYYDRANYKYHMRTAHLNLDAKDTICSHKGCEHSFKTKKQKLMHHDKLDEECRTEKNSLLRLLSLFKKTVEELTKNYDIDDSFSSDFLSLSKESENTKKYIMDVNQYDAIFLGKGTCC